MSTGVFGSGRHGEQGKEEKDTGYREGRLLRLPYLVGEHCLQSPLLALDVGRRDLSHGTLLALWISR